MGESRDFKGVWIPKEIWLDRSLSALDKIILVEIDSLDNEDGCYASNQHFAKFCQCSESAVTKSISKLKSKGYIRQESFDGRSRTLKSCLSSDDRGKDILQNANNKNNDSCFMYYILNEERSKVKIGISINPYQRLCNMQTSTGDDLELLHTIKFKSRAEAFSAETYLHEIFENFKIKKGNVPGKEWFSSVICNQLFEHYRTYEQFDVLLDFSGEHKFLEIARNKLNAISMYGGNYD